MSETSEQKPAVSPVESGKPNEKPAEQPEKPATASNQDWRDQQIHELRDEAKNRRLENKDLKDKLATLETQAAEAAKVPDLTKRLTDLETALTQSKAEADANKRLAIFTAANLPETVVKEMQEQLKDFPTDRLEAHLKTIGKAIPQTTAYKPSLSGDTEDSDKSRAKRIFDRISNRGEDAFSPDMHKAKGGGVEQN